jgi:GTP cyclohydrolase I
MTKENKTISETIRARIQDSNSRFWANDNISPFIEEGETDMLIDELAIKFEGVLDSLIIDRNTDPNSMGTAKRLAKMYINETMRGRYTPPPPVTSFPNTDPDTRYSGMIVVRAEIHSMCSHHHKDVQGVAYIGVLPSSSVIGLSKYIRIAQHAARRGTLQEQLTMDIANEISKATETRDVAVYIQATHGCCSTRGVMANSSLTQTTELRGQFFNQSVKQEFFDNVKMQQQFAGNRA